MLGPVTEAAVQSAKDRQSSAQQMAGYRSCGRLACSAGPYVPKTLSSVSISRGKR